MSEANRCPVCQARFRGARICSRCGADLSRLMVLAVEAWRARDNARTAIAAGEFRSGWEAAVQAQEMQSTRPGAALQVVGEWLARAESAGEKIN